MYIICKLIVVIYYCNIFPSECLQQLKMLQLHFGECVVKPVLHLFSLLLSCLDSERALWWVDVSWLPEHVCRPSSSEGTCELLMLTALACSCILSTCLAGSVLGCAKTDLFQTSNQYYQREDSY